MIRTFNRALLQTILPARLLLQPFDRALLQPINRALLLTFNRALQAMERRHQPPTRSHASMNRTQWVAPRSWPGGRGGSGGPQRHARGTRFLLATPPRHAHTRSLAADAWPTLRRTPTLPRGMHAVGQRVPSVRLVACACSALRLSAASAPDQRPATAKPHHPPHGTRTALQPAARCPRLAHDPQATSSASATMAAPEPLYLRQLLLAHRGTAFGDNLRAKFQDPSLPMLMNADLRNPDQLSFALNWARDRGGGMSAEEEAELNNKIAEGLPFFIKWELVAALPSLFDWQRRFVYEAKRQWQEEGRKRLLGVYTQRARASRRSSPARPTVARESAHSLSFRTSCSSSRWPRRLAHHVRLESTNPTTRCRLRFASMVL